MPAFLFVLTKRSQALLLTLAVATPIAARSDGVTGTASTSWVSDYLFRGQELSGAAVQSSVEADAAGFALGVWESTPVGKEDRWYQAPGRTAERPLADPEIDYYASYTAKLDSAVSFVPGFTLYTFPKATQLVPLDGQIWLPGQFRSTFEPNVALIWTVSGVSISPKLYYDVTKEGLTGEINAATAIPLRAIGTELDFSATFGAFREQRALDTRGTYSLGYSYYSLSGPSAPLPPGGNSGVFVVPTNYPRYQITGGYWQVQGTLPYQLGAHWKAAVSLGYAQGFSGHVREGFFDAPNPLQDRRVIVTVAASYSF